MRASIADQPSVSSRCARCRSPRHATRICCNGTIQFASLADGGVGVRSRRLPLMLMIPSRVVSASQSDAPLINDVLVPRLNRALVRRTARKCAGAVDDADDARHHRDPGATR